jgi:electron transfer flavoprotein-quinone oxidoreductase
MFTVTNPSPKAGGLRITRAAAAKHGVKLRELAADTLRGLRIFG